MIDNPLANPESLQHLKDTQAGLKIIQREKLQNKKEKVSLINNNDITPRTQKPAPPARVLNIIKAKTTNDTEYLKQRRQLQLQQTSPGKFQAFHRCGILHTLDFDPKKVPDKEFLCICQEPDKFPKNRDGNPMAIRICGVGHYSFGNGGIWYTSTCEECQKLLMFRTATELESEKQARLARKEILGDEGLRGPVYSERQTFEKIQTGIKDLEYVKQAEAIADAIRPLLEAKTTNTNDSSDNDKLAKRLEELEKTIDHVTEQLKQ